MAAARTRGVGEGRRGGFEYLPFLYTVRFCSIAFHVDGVFDLGRLQLSIKILLH